MKMLFINSEFPPVGGGAGNASANLARVLVEMGNEVTVVTSTFDSLPSDETREGVRVLRAPAIRRRVDRSNAFEQTVFIFGATFRCLRLLRVHQPDAVLAFFGIPSGVVAWILRLMFGIPYVVSLRGGDVPGFRPYDFWLYHRIAAPLLRLIWHGASAVVTNSRGLRDLARAFDPSINIAVIPNGVDLEHFPCPERAWSNPRILSVGRIVYQKGLDLAIVALAGLNDTEWQWRVVGDGPQLPALQAMLREHHLDSRVQFLGWLQASELLAEYAHANIFLFPSRDEGMPNAVLEAMASGLPVVASRIAGNEELVLDGQTGALIPVGDALALREALRQIVSNRRRREAMGRAGRQRAEREFTWQAAARQYQAILEKATR